MGAVRGTTQARRVARDVGVPDFNTAVVVGEECRQDAEPRQVHIELSLDGLVSKEVGNTRRVSIAVSARTGAQQPPYIVAVKRAEAAGVGIERVDVWRHRNVRLSPRFQSSSTHGADGYGIGGTLHASA